MNVATGNRLPLLAALVAVILWAYAFPASRAVLAYFSVEQVVLLRYLVACGFYRVLCTSGRLRQPALRDLPLIFLLGVLGVTVYQLLFVYGMGRVAGGAAALIITANPVVASLIAWIFLRERLSTLSWLGIAISVAGMAEISLVRGTDGEPAGYLALVVAVVSISIYFVFQKPFFRRYTALEMVFYTTVAGTLPLLWFLPGTLAAVSASPPGPVAWTVAMGIFSSGIGFALWFYALSHLRAGVVTSFLFTQPVFVSLFSWGWLGEIPETKTFVGGAIVLAGLLLILREQVRESHPPPPGRP